jgi:signal transduction histidine kinase
MNSASQAEGALREGDFLVERLRFRQLTTYCLIAWVIYTIVHSLAGYQTAATVEGSGAACTAIILALGFRAPNSRHLYLLANANLLITTVTVAGLSLNGGLANDSAWFLILIPLFAAYQLGERAGKAWATITVVVLILLVQLNSIFEPEPEWKFQPAERDRNRVILVILASAFGVASSRAARAQLEAAQESRRLYKKASEAKSEFLAAMSHELRTPLNAIIGFSQLLVDEVPGSLNPKQKRYQENIGSAAGHLLELVDDVLDISRLEVGTAALTLESLDIERLVQNVLDELRPLAQAKSLELSAELLELPTIQGDKRRVRQILINLVNNAIKFTPQGFVKVTGSLEGEMVELRVEDSGIGLEAKNLELIFARFQQVETGFDRAFDGTGLGLALSRELVEAHGGEIWVTSDGPGKGSCFHFSLPVWKDNTAQEPQ